MRNDEILAQIIDSGLLDRCLFFAIRRYGCHCDTDDLRQDIALIVLEGDNGTMAEIYRKGRINAWLTEVLRRQLNSRKSPHYMQYGRWDKRRVSLNEAMRLEDDGD